VADHGRPRRDHKDVDIRANLDIPEDILERIQARRLRWFGHVVRMEQRSHQTLHYMAKWKGTDPKEDLDSAGWIMLLMTAVIMSGTPLRLHT